MRRIALSAWLLVGTAVVAQAVGGALQWNVEHGRRWTEVRPVGGEKPGFDLIPPALSGVTFSNLLSSQSSLTNQILLNGSGVAAGDFDNDGWCDLYFCGLQRPNALYRNLGNWRFEDVSVTAGVAVAGQHSTGATLVDVDGDRDLDLLVAGIASGVRLFLNDGVGRFSEKTAEFGLRSKSGAASMALADIDNDGDLDLYVVNYRSHTMRDDAETNFRISNTGGKVQLLAVNGRPVTHPDLEGQFNINASNGVIENGEADVLYLNENGERFVRVSWTEGRFLDASGKPLSAKPYDWGLSAMFHDINGDGAPDLYVCNDFHSEDRIWINNGAGIFRAIDADAIRHTSLFSMGVDFSDINRDGEFDFFVADMLSRDPRRRKVQVADPPLGHLRTFDREARPQYSQNTLFLNRGSGRYSEIAFAAGVEASEWSWCPLFLDVDLDGFEDLLITNGHGADVQNIDIAREIEAAKKQPGLSAAAKLELRRKFRPLIYPNVAFRNKGNLQFEEVGSEWGFDSTAISHGLAAADLDNDGDLDLIASTLNHEPLLYRNRSTAPRIAIQVKGVDRNSRGIGTIIKFQTEDGALQMKSVISGGRYLSSDQGRWTFALGNSKSATVSLSVPNGKTATVSNLLPNRIYELSTADLRAQIPPSRERPPWFAEIPGDGLQHSDSPYDDWEQQPLTPRSIASEGPSMAALDADKDGWIDLLVGSGRGGTMQLLRNEQGTRFTAKPLGRPSARDQLGLQFLPDEAEVLATIALSNYESPGSSSHVRLIQVSTGRSAELLTNFPAANSAIALGDPDGDGSRDLLVVGRTIPGRYPTPAPSTFLRVENGRFVVATNAQNALREVGLGTAATFAQLDAEKGDELIIACEWGPMRVFKWANDSFTERTADLGLDRHRGLWQSLATGDFNGDGLVDIVAGNFGSNCRYNAFLADELRLFYSDTDGIGPLEVIEAYRDARSRAWHPIRDLGMLARGLPELNERFPTFAAFSAATIDHAFASTNVSHVSINTLHTTLFLNRGNRFEARALNLEVQFSPAMSLATTDFNQDGHLDLFIGQNFHGVHPQDARLDAGYSLLLAGTGEGNFRALSIAESGLRIQGEARGVALADFDRDGKPDLAVGENNGPIRIFRNQSAAK